MSAPTRPVLRYFGGKWRLAPWILQHFPPHRCYVEPYGGAASVLLQKSRAYAEVYNDLDGEVVNVFRVLRDPVSAAELQRRLALTPYARAVFEEAYQPFEDDDPIGMAWRTITKSFMGFGSNAIQVCTPRGRGFRTCISTARPPTGFRCDSNRSGSTPAADWRNYIRVLPLFVERMQGVVIECRAALEVIDTFDRSDALHYIDPPYPHSTRQNVRKDIYRFEMTDDDHRELARALHAAEGAVVLSGYPCALYDEELYADWTRVERRARADRQRAATEVLWLNARAAAGVQGSLFDAVPTGGTAEPATIQQPQERELDP